MTPMLLRSGLSKKNMRLLAGSVADPIRLYSFIEQGTISAANFVALLMLARSFDPAVFGAFSFAYIALLFFTNLHRSMLVLPFVIHTAERARLNADGWLWQQFNLLLTLVAVGALALAAAASRPLGAPAWMTEAIVAAAVFVPAAFYYEFLRRWVIQLGDCRRVAAAATAYAVVFVAGTLWAVAAAHLWLAVLAFACANVAAALVCLPAVLRSGALTPNRRLRAFLYELGHFLTWSLLCNLAYNFFYHVPGLILGAVAGPVPVAAFQAVRTFVQPLSTIGTALDNFDKPRAARALVTHGHPGMKRQLALTAGTLLLLGAPYILLLILAGDWLIAKVYADRYGEFAFLINYWMAVHVLAVWGYPFENGLFLVKRPDLLFRGRLVTALAAIATAVVAIPYAGVSGAMWSLLVGGVLNALFASHYLRQVTHA